MNKLTYQYYLIALLAIANIGQVNALGKDMRISFHIWPNLVLNAAQGFLKRICTAWKHYTSTKTQPQQSPADHALPSDPARAVLAACKNTIHLNSITSQWLFNYDPPTIRRTIALMRVQDLSKTPEGRKKLLGQYPICRATILGD